MIKARMFLVLRYTPTYANIAFFFFPHMLKGMSQEKVWKFPLSLVGVFFFFPFPSSALCGIHKVETFSDCGRGGVKISFILDLGGGRGGVIYIFVESSEVKTFLDFGPFMWCQMAKTDKRFVITHSC